MSTLSRCQHYKDVYTIKMFTLSRCLHYQDVYTIKMSTLSNCLHYQNDYTIEMSTLSKCLHYRDVFTIKMSTLSRSLHYQNIYTIEMLHSRWGSSGTSRVSSVAQALTFAINFIDIGSTYIVSNISKLVKYIRDALDNTYWFKILSYFTMARFARLGENSPKNRRRKSIWRKICSRIEEWSYLSLLTEYLQFLCLSLATILVSPPHYSLFYCLEFYLTRATKISGHNCECLILSVSSARCKVESFFNHNRVTETDISSLRLTLIKWLRSHCQQILQLKLSVFEFD